MSKKKLTISLVVFLLLNCRKPYSPPDSELGNVTLVVEGLIAVGDSADNRFLLSKLKSLGDSSLNDPEERALVSIESLTGKKWVLPELSPGAYQVVDNFPSNTDYRLRITTTNGNIYETPFLKPVNTPPIDSLTWLEPEDMNIYVHTHDPGNSTKYYRWEFAETWEYRSIFESFIKFDGTNFQYREPGEMTYSCFRYRLSNSIIINNTTALAEDRISYQLLKKIPNGAEELSVRYSILVRQVGFTKEAYEFWNILKKNTELTGSLFDPQPSLLPGNILCVNRPGEKAIGYVCAGKQQLKRLFISYSELILPWPKGGESDYCKELKSDSTRAKDTLRQDSNFLPAYFIGTDGDSVAVAKKLCVDCREKGGSTKKPLYW
jgi:hypothetical protein